MSFALEELSEKYPPEEIKAMLFWLFDEFLGVGRAQYLLNPNKRMSESEMLKFNFAIKDLKKGKPLQYILGYTYFMDLKLNVNAHTLIPRPETEEMVQLIIAKEKNKKQILKIIDIGTGTACIPLALAQAMPQHHYFGIDYKKEIMELADKNCKTNQHSIQLYQLDILNDSTEHLPIFDIIISNPPYVLESEKEQMHENVLHYEPASALYVSDTSPLLFYEQIILFAHSHLKLHGRLFFEINENYGPQVCQTLLKHHFKKTDLLMDFRGRNRFVFCEK